jgi:hypothetical protein
MDETIPQEWVEKAADSMSIPYLRVLLMAAGGDLEANRNITEAIARAALAAVAPLIRADEREWCAKVAYQAWVTGVPSEEIASLIRGLHDGG